VFFSSAERSNAKEPTDKNPKRRQFPRETTLEHGQVIGSTNKKGEHPHDRPLTPNDLWATVYEHLGIDQDATITDYNGRPQPLLPFGEPIRELL
jgi:hypothetical protein